MLGPYRVLDLTDEQGWFAGMLLAQLGADVVLVEPDGGWPRDGRSRYHHLAYNRGKRSITIAEPGEIDALAAEADIILDNGGYDRSGFGRTAEADHRHPAIDLADLRSRFPELITVRTTPWGGTGPKADWRATDLTLFASSGQLAVTGDSDRPPVRISIPQAWLHAESQAAVAALVALEHRARIGRGQHVDLSAQEAVCETAMSASLFAPAGLAEVGRSAGGVRSGTLQLRSIFACRDGHVIVTIAFGPMIGPMFQRFLTWMAEEGAIDRATVDKDWVDFAIHVQDGTESPSTIERVMDQVAEFALTKTKAEFQERGLADALLICPVNDLQDVLDSPQLADRGFWDDHDGLRLPGRVVAAGASPLPPLDQAPEPDQHRDDLAPSPDRSRWRSIQVSTGSPTGTPPIGFEPGTDPDRLPLAGLKVADLSWVAAAPLATKILAHWGATVVRIESQTRPCLLRGALGHRDDIPDQENGIAWHSTNANKLSIALDLATNEAREVVADLATWADVVTESFTPGTMDRWGLGYEHLRARNPDLIMLSSCVMGQTGPLRSFAGFGNMAASVAGFFDITGWGDRGPAGPYLAYTDYCSPRFTVAAILAAVDHHRRTGQGQHLDFSQMEAAVHLLAPALIELQETGDRRTRRGNDDDELVPHGVYPAAGDDQWIAIAVEDDEAWRSLAIELNRPDLADLDRDARAGRAGELDQILADWTAGQDATGLTHRLQAHGVAAHQVQNSSGCIDDPQLLHRNHFQWLPHSQVRRALVEGIPFTLSEADQGYRWAGPTYGEHTSEILEDILGYDVDRIAELAIAGALQ